MTPWYTRELYKQLWQSKAENSRWERNMGRIRKCSGCFREQKQWNSKTTEHPEMAIMYLTGKITLGSCLLCGCLPHLTNFGSIWVLPSVSCMSSVCKAASLSASPCSWQKLQIGALCTTKERLLFLHECTKCLALGILTFRGKLKSCAWSPFFIWAPGKCRAPGVAGGRRGSDSQPTGCCEHCCFHWPSGQRCLIYKCVLSPNCAWFIFVRCVEQEAVCVNRKPWLCVVGNLVKPSLPQTRKASPNPQT